MCWFNLNFYLHRLQQAICAADLFPGHACSCGGVLPIWSASLLWQREQLGYAHEALPSPCGLNTYCTSQQCCSIFCFYEKVPFFFLSPHENPRPVTWEETERDMLHKFLCSVWKLGINPHWNEAESHSECLCVFQAVWLGNLSLLLQSSYLNLGYDTV